MKSILKILLLFLFTLAVIFAFIRPKVNQPKVEIPLETSNYMNGVWVSTVYNLDYPNQPTQDIDSLKAQIIDILDNCDDMTDIFFQVRPCADAFYRSEIFPTSAYLTGAQGTDIDFDPLEFFIQEAHARGKKLHAWINPYRVTKTSSDVLSSDNIAVLKPELTVLHTDGAIYFNPALEEVQNLIVSGVEEILKNYDVDGIHLDDYFYPSGDFNDSVSFETFSNGKTLDEFRRDNVTSLIRKLDETVDKYGDDILFGVSPFGIWANETTVSGGSKTTGSQSYINQYADTKKWVEDGILDYIAPQIYWEIGFNVADYAVLVDWWNDLVSDTDVLLYIGHANYKEADGRFSLGEIDRQIAYNKTKDHVSGSIFFRYEHIKK